MAPRLPLRSRGPKLPRLGQRLSTPRPDSSTIDDMSKASLQIVYDGPALQTHEMEVRDLAPALLALGELFEEANATLNDGRSKVSVNVKGSFKTGCFAIDLSVTQSLMQQAQDLFAGNAVTAALNLIAILGLAGTSTKGVFHLIKWVRNRKITNVEIMADGVVRIYCDDDHFDTEQAVLALFRNWKLRKAFQDVVYKPLQKPGIDYFAVRDKKEGDFAAVSADEAEDFVAPEQEEEFLDETDRTVNLQVVNVAFKNDNKWRFFDGASTFYATILDEGFLADVNNGDRMFANGDLLKVILRERKTLSGDVLKADREILEVIDHRRAGVQLHLPISTKTEL